MADNPPPTKRAHVTPRNSIANAAEEQTPFVHLHQLGRLINQKEPANAIQTPIARPRRAGALDPSSGNSRVTPNTTPGTNNKIPNAPRSGQRSGLRKPTTPHGIRAQLQSQQQRRHAGATPARDRRRSGRTDRDTPRDGLRILSRVLAPTTRPIPTPAPGTPRRRRLSRTPSIYEDNSPVEPPPRLSMSRGDLLDDDTSFHEAPPRLSVGLEEADRLPGDGDVTLEGLRRDTFSRRSLGRPDMSFGDLARAFVDEEAEEDDDHIYSDMDKLVTEVFDSEVGENETTRNLRLMERLSSEGGRLSPATDADGNTTFQFIVPEITKSRLSLREPSMAEVVRDDTLPLGRDDTVALGGDDDVPQFDGSVIDIDAEGESDPDEAPGIDFSTGIDISGAVESEDEDILNESALNDYLGESTHVDNSTTRLSTSHINTASRPIAQPKKVSRHGTTYSSLPSSLIKKLASTFSRSAGGNGKVSRDAISALSDASDWFFQQVSEDLAAYATHGKRKRIEEGDVVVLMKRQRQITERDSLFSVAAKNLPGELLQAVRMPPAGKGKGKKFLETIDEEGADESTFV